MAYALIDNATLTAVQRILGKAPTRSEHSTDTDILALENLVQAILFYDDLIAIDDYKPEYNLQRKKLFHFVQFLGQTEFDIGGIEKKAREETGKITTEIRAGEFTNADFRSFFDLLEMNIITTWDISSSVYYLTLKMLGEPETTEFQKYSNLTAAIFSELQGRKESRFSNVNNTLMLYDKYGNLIKPSYEIPYAKWGQGETGGITSGLSSFTSALTWLAFKTIFYLFVSKHIRADTFLHPVRQAFQINYMEKKKHLCA